VSISVQFHTLGGAGGLAGAAAAADAGVDPGDHFDEVAVSVPDLFLFYGAVGADLLAGEAGDAVLLGHLGDDRFALQFVLGKEGHYFGRCGTRLGDGVGDVFGSLAGAGEVDPGRGALDRPQFRMGLGVEVVLVIGDPQLLGKKLGAGPRLDCGGQNDHVSFDFDLDAEGDVAPHDDDLVPFLVEAGDGAADVDGVLFFDGSAPEFVVAFARGPGIHEEDVGLAVVDLVVIEHGVLGGVHAADLGAVGDSLLSGPAADALDEDDGPRLFAVGGAEDLAAGGAGGTGQPLEGHAVDDVGVLAVAEFAVALDGGAFRLFGDVVELEAGGDDDGPDRFDHKLVFLGVVDCARSADFLADAAFAGLEVRAVLPVDDRGVGYRLREGDVDGGAHPEVLVEGVGDLFLRAFGHADAAAGAFVHVDASGLLLDGDLEVADVAVDVLDFRVGMQGDVGVVGDVDHFGGHDALGAVKRGEGLGQLGHVAADGGFPFDEDDVVPAVGNVEGGLDAGDAAADDEGPFGDRYGDRLELFVHLDPLEEHGDDFGGFLGGLFFVFVDPGAVFADVGHLDEVGVQASCLGRFPEGLFVHPG